MELAHLNFAIRITEADQSKQPVHGWASADVGFEPFPG
jgi:hypothetical protein